MSWAWLALAAVKVGELVAARERVQGRRRVRRMVFCWIRLSGNASSIRAEVIAAHVSTLAQYRIFKPTTLCRIHHAVYAGRADVERVDDQTNALAIGGLRQDERAPPSLGRRESSMTA